MTKPARFTKADVARLMSGAKAAGFTRVRLAIDEQGRMVIDAGMDEAMPTARVNPLDARLLGR